MPTSITLRATKGSALTHNEVDDNFSNLKTTADAALPTASLGTGVATALAVNVGSAGAFVTLNGALGTPSSGTLTNATGLPAAGVVGTAAVLGANTFTALQTITQASANAGIIASTGYSLTGSDATGMVNLAGTWNTSGNPVALKIAITNTASGSTSKFLSFLAGAAGATEVFAVLKTGAIQLEGTKQTITPQNGYGLIFSQEIGTSIYVGNGEVRQCLGGKYAWNDSASNIVASADTGLARNAAGVVEVNSGTAGTYRDLIGRTLLVAPSSANGQKLGLTELTELTTIAAAATTDTTIQMPAGAIVMGVSVRVTTVIPDATSFDVGDSGSATRFSTASVGVAANSTDAGTKAGAYYNASALSVRLTMNGTPPAANTGRVRVTIYYFLSTPPTS